MRYFRIREDKALGYTGFVDAAHKWGLPGVDTCPACKATWAGAGTNYPSVDLTPVTALADFTEARAEPLEEYERLRDLVRPFLPPGAVVEPGSCFGPLVGKAQGRFGQFVSNYSDLLLVRREALEKLQAEGLRGLKGCRMEVRFRQRHSPELLELELLPVGRLHPKCLPPDLEPPCPRCGRQGLTLPKEPVLDVATLPPDLDLFRLVDMTTLVVCTERFAEACQRLGLDGIVFLPLPAEG
ncbi:double-CXXCG motif protein [Archangium sp.]|uniref:SitI6 family double-CXXCG motif immunity protein n=1 Tax=Archangium sp. TaxID=1872627 RepID=UPI00286CDCA0|nr:double-CXXCG motif protein [Archangium sp.]